MFFLCRAETPGMASLRIFMKKMSADSPIPFTSILDRFDSNLWAFHILVPEAVSKIFLDQGNARVVCTLNDTLSFQCALMPKGEGVYFININKKIRDELKLKLGMQVQASLVRDDSTYGLPMPEELRELLELDEEGDRLFHALTPGKQRNLLYIAGQPKTSDKRIERALVLVEHLKANGGKIDFKQLYHDLKANK